MTAIDKARAELALPASFVVAWQGAAAAFQTSLTNELLLIAAAIATMYIVLGVLYESFVHPVTILSTLPSASVGALLTLLVFGYDLDIIAIIGIILLIGIVKKNAIMMIDFALEAERVEGISPVEAIRQACLLRFRPILMTTMAAILGALPLMLGSGVGSELRQPLGYAIVGGLVVSQLLTLFTTPVIYLYFDRLALQAARQARFRRGAGPGGTRPNEYLRPLHPAAGRDHPAHHRHRACGRPVLFPAAGLALPHVDIPTVSVNASLPGASPETMANSVAEPLERHLGQIAEVTEMTSQSSLGQTRLTLQFNLNRNIDGAARDVQAAISAARADLPTSLRSNPDLSQGQSGRRSHPHPEPDLENAYARPDLRCRQQCAAAAHFAARGHWRGHHRRRVPARHPHRTQSARPVQIWHRAGGCARRAGLRQRQRPKGEIEEGGRLPDLHQRSGIARRGL